LAEFVDQHLGSAQILQSKVPIRQVLEKRLDVLGAFVAVVDIVDETVLAPLLDRFVAWSIPRAAFLVATFWAVLSALAMQASPQQRTE
jgi:hypothetical protein